MEPHEYENLTRHLAELHWKNLQGIAEQDPTLTSLKRVLEQNSAIACMDLQGLQDFCTQLEAQYGVDHGRGT
jgi:hypothetical protein